jgi:hypothetical protein
MARAAILLCIFLFPSLLRAQDVVGHWEGTVTLPTRAIPIQVDFDHLHSGWQCTILVPETTAPVYTAKSVSVDGAHVQINLEMEFSSVSLDGQLSGDAIAGTFTRDGAKYKFEIRRAASANPPGAESSRRPNSAPQPGRDESPTAGPAKSAESGEGSRTSGPQVQAVVVTAPRETRVIRDDQGDSRGVIPAANGGDSDNGMPKFYAVLFGSDNYTAPEWPHLNNPIDDANSIAQELQAFYGFDAKVLRDQTSSGVKELFIGDRLQTEEHWTFKPNDELLIYFAGHGEFDENDGRGYIITKDSAPPGDSHEHQIDFDELTKWMDKINVGHILLVLDICQVGSIFLGGTRGEVPPPALADKADAVQRLRGLKTRKCMTSGGMGAVKDGRAGQGSPFARTFMEVLGEAGPNTDYMVLNVDEVAGKVKKIMGRTEGASKPEFGSCASDKPASDFFFIWQPAQK